MALIKCPECGREISSQAPSCPGCGCPISSGKATNLNVAQIRVVCKTATIKIEGQSTTHGSIVTVPVSGSKKIRIYAWGGEVGMFGSGIDPVIQAGKKYDLDMHLTVIGRMLYLKEVEAFM